MQFTILIPLALLATHVLADGAAIIAAMTVVSKATVALNTTVAAFPSNPFADILQIGPLLIDSITLLNDINEATDVANASANLTLSETISIASATIALASVVESTLKTIVAAKPKFDALFIVSPIILLNLEQEQSATDKFGAAVTAKVPSVYQGLAESLIAPIDTAFNASIAAYEA